MKINNIEITGLTNNSRHVKPGFAFFAVRGFNRDGTKYIPQAIEAGATVIVTDEEYEGESFKVPNVRKFLIECAAEFYKPFPGNMVAVTGTAGKTSVVHFCKYILEQLGKDVASVGTLGLIHNGQVSDIEAGRGSPDAVLFCEALGKLKKQGVDHIAFEATSDGIDQYRIPLHSVKVAGFTNLSVCAHLITHGTMDNYFAAKKRLFTEILAPDGIAVLNADHERFPEFHDIERKVISYGKNGEHIKLLDVEHTDTGQKVTVGIGGQVYDYETNAPGIFQTHNSMCALGMIMGLGFDPADVVRAMKGMTAPCGRMQYIGSPVKGGGVYVDYAHTPDGLRSLLMSARPICSGRLMVLFGTGGDRSPEPRPIAGQVMDELADVVYVTDDSWRNEDPAVIRAQIAAGCPKAINIAGRAAAIKQAIEDMQDHDVLILACKGHEDFIEHYDENGEIYREHFSDIEEAEKCLAELAKKYA